MSLEAIIAVIVLYKSSLEASETFQSLLKSIEQHEEMLTLLVYNNSPNYWIYNNKEYNKLRIIYTDDFENSGVSKAYNTAFDYSKLLNKKYLLLLDQDTILSELFFNAFLEYESKYNNSAKLFCPMIVTSGKLLSPAKSFMFSGKRLNFINPGLHKLDGLVVINSGLIISTELFESVGGYNNKIKLDFSDFDFLKRSKKITDKIAVLDTKCVHQLSGENEMSLQNALKRFDYYLTGAIHYNKTILEAIALMAWVFLRSVKLNIKFKTNIFTKNLFIFALKSI